jgi:hypothetical protein
MRIAVAADHGEFDMKQVLIARHLRRLSKVAQLER